MTTTITCTRRACGKTFDEENNKIDACQFHPGNPVFHEGLKSWSCCSSTNRGVTDFNDFLAIKGCATGTHSSEPLPVTPKPTPIPSTTPTQTDSQGREIYGGQSASTSVLPLPLPPAPTPSAPAKPVSTAYVEEQDDPEVVLVKGVSCKRRGCGQSWNGESREGEECVYHPGSPIFHEGSKGNSCCKPRAMDFDEFLAIKGCRTGKHLFVGAKKLNQEEELVECRVDHYQTPRQVHISIFGKGSNKETSKVTFEVETMHVDLFLPLGKRFTKSFSLYGPIDPATSTFSILGTKCEVVLSKADARSWPSISPLSGNAFVPQLAFSSGGGRGTTGSHEAILDGQNQK